MRVRSFAIKPHTRFCRLLGVVISALALALPAGAEELSVVSWDGSYVKSQVLGFIRPYERSRNVDVEIIQYSGGIEEIRRQVRAWNVRWDVVDLELFDAIRACNEGLLVKIDPADLPAAPDGTAAVDDFVEPALMECGVGNVVGSTVVAYDRQRLERPPRHIRDFFNVRDFPGRRGLRRTPQINLEWALIADGVERHQVYETLSTEEGVNRAFKVLDSLKPYIDWWESGEDAIRLLETGQVAMSSVYSGRVYDAVNRGEQLDILWDHQIWFYDVWGIPRNGENIEQALDFVQFATSTESLARQASYIPYGPVRHSSLELVDERMRSMLPTAEENLATALEIDARWWSENLDRLNRRFERWLERPVMVPRDLPR
ncbi:ABC transporter substrate-binding protein [Gilvimarinus sp. F26214L]|uniref:ABC transporter substrate-binding protein n=1 Tax=Gilvimarinus sp. DZF01 TaxID=3461371 RepID=UPI00404583FF